MAKGRRLVRVSDFLRREGWFLASAARPRSSSWSPTSPPPRAASPRPAPSRRSWPAPPAPACAPPSSRSPRSRSGLFLVCDNDQDALSNGIRVGVLLVTTGLAPTVARLREDRERRIHDLTRVARVAQDAVLTPVPPTSGALRLAIGVRVGEPGGTDRRRPVRRGVDRPRDPAAGGRRPRQGPGRRQDRGDGARPLPRVGQPGGDPERAGRALRPESPAAPGRRGLRDRAVRRHRRRRARGAGQLRPPGTGAHQGSDRPAARHPRARRAARARARHRRTDSRSGCSWSPATACCSSPTAWPRPATATATSSTCASS